MAAAAADPGPHLQCLSASGEAATEPCIACGVMVASEKYADVGRLLHTMMHGRGNCSNGVVHVPFDPSIPHTPFSVLEQLLGNMPGTSNDLSQPGVRLYADDKLDNSTTLTRDGRAIASTKRQRSGAQAFLKLAGGYSVCPHSADYPKFTGQSVFKQTFLRATTGFRKDDIVTMFAADGAMAAGQPEPSYAPKFESDLNVMREKFADASAESKAAGLSGIMSMLAEFTVSDNRGLAHITSPFLAYTPAPLHGVFATCPVGPVPGITCELLDKIVEAVGVPDPDDVPVLRGDDEARYMLRAFVAYRCLWDERARVSPRPNVEARSCAGINSLFLVATRNIAPGDVLLRSYGPEDWFTRQLPMYRHVITAYIKESPKLSAYIAAGCPVPDPARLLAITSGVVEPVAVVDADELVPEAAVEVVAEAVPAAVAEDTSGAMDV